MPRRCVPRQIHRKVKEPLREEYELLEPRHTLFTFLTWHPTGPHQGLVDSGATSLATRPWRPPTAGIRCSLP